MRHLRLTALLAALLATSAAATSFRISPHLGYAGGVGAELQLHLDNISGSPVGVRVTTAFHLADPYDDNYDLGGFTLGDAKRTGEVHEAGFNLNAGVDLTYQLPFEAPNTTLTAFVGPRYDAFHGVISSSSGYIMDDTFVLGAGTGLILAYNFTPHFAATFEGGLDAYLPATFDHIVSGSGGMDTVASTIAPGDQGYSEYNKFVQQPSVLGKLKLGLRLSF